MNRLSSMADVLWGKRARLGYLMIASFVMLFAMLGAREIWTQEHRWADIVSGMFYRHDFLHPYLGQNTYYDKPLLSYWLIALVSMVTGQLNTWALRVPSALAGMLAVWATYRIGRTLKDNELGLMSGWLLLTTFYFVFWARTSSADMLNLAGSVFAVSWYLDRRRQPSLFNYAVFFLIIALTSLCKGLVGAIVPCLAVLTDVVLQKNWREHLRVSVLIAMIPAAIVYLLPFWLSSFFGGDQYGQSGLYMVFRENVLRYFQPFDHQGPIYTYFIYLPVYLLPWTVFFIPALFAILNRWKQVTLSSKWIAWTLLVLFLFFTCSGSRRSYYVLPMVPFAILFTADWIASGMAAETGRRCYAAGLTIISFILLFLALDVLPAWYYSQVGAGRFAQLLKEEAVSIQPWNQWNIVLLDAESKLNFYLQLTPDAKYYDIKGLRKNQTTASLLTTWPVLTNKPDNTIFITRQLYVPMIESYFEGYQKVKLPTQINLPFLKSHDENAPVAFVPNKK